MTEIHENFTPQQLIDDVVDEALLLRVGLETIAVIRARTQRGEFLEGSSPGASAYSTTPSPLPYSRLAKLAQANVEQLAKSGEARIFKSRAGRLWVMLQGGYRKFRELAGKTTSPVGLQWSGTMMRAMHVGDVDAQRKSVTLRFSDNRSGEIAGYHHEGAGRSRVRRIFFDLTDSELSGVVRTAGLGS